MLWLSVLPAVSLPSLTGGLAVLLPLPPSLPLSYSGPKASTAPTSPGALSVLRHIPPPPPPKNPARLMALALAESAHQAALQQKQQAGLGQREPRTHFRRSLSLECKAGELSSGARALYSMVRPGPKALAPSSLQSQARGRSVGSQCRDRQGGNQVRGGEMVCAGAGVVWKGRGGAGPSVRWAEMGHLGGPVRSMVSLS